MTDQKSNENGDGPFAGGPAGLFGRIFNEDNPVRHQIDRNARALAQSALTKLDVVSREEFDAQTAVLQRTREHVSTLEAELERLSNLLESQDKS